MRIFRNRSITLAVIAILLTCSSWGFLMHRTISQLSVYQLPKEMQPFFYQNMDYLVRHSVRPDERRNSDPEEATKHFIDFEAYGHDAAHKMPTDWEAAVTSYSKDTLLKYGYVPYWIIVMKSRLTAAFKSGIKDSILFYAADMAHYIQDAHVPLHTTINYDGQLSNQKGIHSLWESVVPELTLDQFNLKGDKKANYLKSPEKEIWKTVRHTFTLVPGVLEKEREVSRNFTDSTKYRYQTRNGRESRYYTKEFALAYERQLEPTFNEQAVKAANLVADFWYTAWVDAGKPNLNGVMTKTWDKATADKLKREVKAYGKNNLLKEGLLLSKQNAEKGGE